MSIGTAVFEALFCLFEFLLGMGLLKQGGNSVLMYLEGVSVVSKREEGSGQRWARSSVELMLFVSSAVTSGRNGGEHRRERHYCPVDVLPLWQHFEYRSDGNAASVCSSSPPVCAALSCCAVLCCTVLSTVSAFIARASPIMRCCLWVCTPAALPSWFGPCTPHSDGLRAQHTMWLLRY